MLQTRMSPSRAVLRPYVWAYGMTTGRVESAPLLVPLPARPKQLQIYHNTFLKGSVCEKKSVAIRFVTNDVAIAHLVWNFYGGAPLPDGTPPKTKNDPYVDLATLVLVKQNGKWLLTAGHNVHIDKGAQFDPVKQMPKLPVR